MSIGDEILQEITGQAMFKVAFPDPDTAHIFVWSSGAAEQLDAVVANSPQTQIKDGLISLYSHVLTVLGAPDDGAPKVLLEWAHATIGEIVRLKEWNQERAGQFSATEQRLASRIAQLENRIHWLHTGSATDREGYEWGIYRVKWENGVPVSVLHARSDLSDLDAEIAREEKEK